MAVFRCTLQFDHFSGGWTEGFFATAAGVNTCYDNIQGIIATRMGLSPPSVLLEGVRISQYPSDGPPAPNPRIGRFFPSNVNGISVAAAAPDIANTAALLQFTAANNRSRRYEAAGLPDSQTVFDPNTGRSLPGGALTLAINAFIAALVAPGANVGTRGTSRASDSGFNWINVAAVQGTAAGPGGQLRVSTVGDHNLQTNDYVSFGRINQQLVPKLNGTWQVSVIDATHFTVPYITLLTNSGTVSPPKLRVRKVGYITSALSAGSFERFVARKIGRPTAASRGRTKAVSNRG